MIGWGILATGAIADQFTEDLAALRLASGATRPTPRDPTRFGALLDGGRF